MKGYSVHLLFHVLAAVIGITCGATAVVWLLGGHSTAMWLFLGALLLAVAVLVAQFSYIRGTPSGYAGDRVAPGSQRSSRGSGATAVRARSAPASDTRVQPPQAGSGAASRPGTRPDLRAGPEPDPGTAVHPDGRASWPTAEQQPANPSTRRW